MNAKDEIKRLRREGKPVPPEMMQAYQNPVKVAHEPELYEKYLPGEYGVIIGTGPSAEKFNRRNHPRATVIGLTWAGVLEGVDFVLCADSWQYSRVIEDVEARKPILMPCRFKRYMKDPGEREILYYDDEVFVAPAKRHSTAHAIMILYKWGIKNIGLYGCDSFPNADMENSTTWERLPRTARVPLEKQVECYQEINDSLQELLAEIGDASICWMHMDEVATQEKKEHASQTRAAFKEAAGADAAPGTAETGGEANRGGGEVSGQADDDETVGRGDSPPGDHGHGHLQQEGTIFPF